MLSYFRSIAVGVTVSLAAAFPALAEGGDIAVVIKIEGVPWYTLQGQGVDQAAKEFGVKAFQIGPTEADPAQQVKIVEDLIARGVAAIAIQPNDAKVLGPVLTKAQQAGIKVVSNESAGQPGADWNVEFTNPEMFGTKIFEDLAKGMGGKGKYAVYVGTLTAPLHNKWADIGIEYLKKNYPEMEMVTNRFGVGESADAARATTLDLLKAHPDLKGIAAIGSLGPIGAAQALTEVKKTDDVYLSGTFIPSQGLRYLKNGAIDRGTLWSPATGGYILTGVAAAVIQGKPVGPGFKVGEFEATQINQETKTIEFNAMIDITAENAASFGF